MINSIINSSLSILNFWEVINRANNAKKTQLLLISLECKKNLNYLNILKLDNKKIRTSDKDFKEIALMLENEMLEMFYLHYYDNNNIFTSIKKKITGIFILEENKEITEINEVTINKILEYLYIKIDVIKKIIGIKKEGKGAKNIYFKKRLRNIRDNLIMVNSFLEELKKNY